MDENKEDIGESLEEKLISFDASLDTGEGDSEANPNRQGKVKKKKKKKVKKGASVEKDLQSSLKAEEEIIIEEKAQTRPSAAPVQQIKEKLPVIKEKPQVKPKKKELNFLNKKSEFNKLSKSQFQDEDKSLSLA